MPRGDTTEWGITDEDRSRFRNFLNKSYFDRSPDDLVPAEEDER